MSENANNVCDVTKKRADTRRACARCHNVRFLVARGLCNSCYVGLAKKVRIGKETWATVEEKFPLLPARVRVVRDDAPAAAVECAAALAETPATATAPATGHGFVPGDILVPIGGNRRMQVFAAECGELRVAPMLRDGKITDMSLADWLGVIPNGATRWVAPAQASTAPANATAPAHATGVQK